MRDNRHRVLIISTLLSMAASEEAPESAEDIEVRKITCDPYSDAPALTDFKEIKDPLNEPWRRNRKGMLKRSRK